MGALYEWDREVADDDGDTVVLGVRGDRVYLDVQQENGLLSFSLERFGEFVAAALMALTEADGRPKAADAAGPVG